MPTEEDIIKEILKFDPGGPAQSQPKQIDPVIQEILKFDPAPNIGGTYQTKASAQPGAIGPEISTITGKPATEYVFGPEKEASFEASKEAGLVDDPAIKARIYSEARGMPIERYRNRDGNIEFLTDDGVWQREVGELPLSKIIQGIAESVSDPRTYLGTAGAVVGGVKGAVLGTVLGGRVRKAIARTVYGQKPESTWDNLTDIGMDAIIALGGEALSLPFKSVSNKILAGQNAKLLRFAGSEVRRGTLTPQDHAKALFMKRAAAQHGIDLPPHALYDKEGMTNLWMYLRKHPLTSDHVRIFEDKLTKQTDDAINRFIVDMGGLEDSPFGIGTRVKKVAGEILKDSVNERRTAAKPYYQAAFDANPSVDIKPVVDYIETELQNAKGSVRNGLLKAKRLLEKPDLPKKYALVDSSGRPFPPSYDTSLRGLHAAKVDIDNLVSKQGESSLGNTNRRHLMKIKKLLLEQMDSADQNYATARAFFKERSEPIDRLRNSIIGQIEELEKDKQIGKATRVFFDSANMTDELLLRQAKSLIKAKDPDLWKQMIGSYVRDVYENLVKTEEGKVLNAAGKMQKRLFGSSKKEAIMRAAMEPDQFDNFKSLMEVFQRAGIGSARQSMTQPFKMIEKEIMPMFGSRAHRFLSNPKQETIDWVFGKWNDFLLSGQQNSLMDALVQPDIVNKLRSIKRLTPGSERFIEAMSVLTVMVGDKINAAELAVDTLLPAHKPTQTQGQ